MNLWGTSQIETIPCNSPPDVKTRKRIEEKWLTKKMQRLCCTVPSLIRACKSIWFVPTKPFLKIYVMCQAWCFIPVIVAVWKAEIGSVWVWAQTWQFSDLMRLYLKNKIKRMDGWVGGWMDGYVTQCKDSGFNPPCLSGWGGWSYTSLWLVCKRKFKVEQIQIIIYVSEEIK